MFGLEAAEHSSGDFHDTLITFSGINALMGMEDLDWLGYAVRMVDLLRDSDGAEVPENFTKTLELMG